MGNINAYYSFCRTVKDNDKRAFKLKRIEKWGNHQLFNHVFECHESAKVSYYDVPSIKNYLLYAIEGNPNRSRSFKVLFEMSPMSYPCGIIRSERLEEVVLFKIISKTAFEVYVMEKHVSNVMNCFQLLLDGYLEEEIDEIKQRIDFEG